MLPCMIPFDEFLLFTAASVALAIAPGPDNIFVLAQSALYGRRAGILITLGLCTGLLVHISAVALGVAAILQKSVLAFNVLKMVGAGYLLYLAWRAFRADAVEPAGHKNGPMEPWTLYARGILMNVTNPKVAIFFLAFLPQFADPDRGPVPLQIVLLGAVFMICTLVVFAGIAWAASYIGQWLKQSKRAHMVMNRTAGLIFLLLAGRLALSRQ
jgi:Putative threonine efflux protein